MSHQEPAPLNEQNHGIENELLAFDRLSEVCDQIVAEKTLVVASIWSALNTEGHVEIIADAFTDPNEAARNAGIELHLRTIGASIKRAVEVEARRRIEAMGAEA